MKIKTKELITKIWKTEPQRDISPLGHVFYFGKLESGITSFLVKIPENLFLYGEPDQYITESMTNSDTGGFDILYYLYKIFYSDIDGKVDCYLNFYVFDETIKELNDGLSIIDFVDEMFMALIELNESTLNKLGFK